MRLFSKIATVTLLCIAFRTLDAQQETAASNEVQVGPIPVTQPINGIAVTLPITSSLNVTTGQNSLQFDARIVADLSDLQAKSGPIIDTFPVPTDNCRSFSANNQVVKIWGKELV